MCFFLGKFISEIHEYSQKSEKFSSSLWMQVLAWRNYWTAPDIYLRVKKTEHMWDIRYFSICAKADWCHRLEVFLFEI